jgi:hypothetical protein
MTAAQGTLVALALLTLVPALLPAEEKLAIMGTVVDENGAPVRDARITALPAASSGDQGAGPAQPAATSDPAGLFTIEVPAPGDYRIQAECEGFFVFTNPSVSLDETMRIEIHMNHLRELAESVDVHFSPPVIDPTQTSDTRQLDNQQILNVPFPSTQDYRNAFALMPGALLDNSGQIHFNGGNTNQTNYRLNGFEVSDPATGGLNARLNVDTVQTLEWDASRFSPSEGKGSAGSIDIRTEMGDNHWRFEGTNFIPGLGAQDGVYVNHWSPRVKVSGPIKKGRAWFHNAFDTYYTANTVASLPSGQNRTSSFIGSDLTRLQWNVTDTQILSVGFLANIGNSDRNGLSFLSPAETTTNQRQALFLGTIKDQWMVAGGLVEFGFAQTSAYVRSSPQGDLPYVVTPLGASGNYFEAQTTHTGREEWLANAFLAPLHAHGSHQFQFGVDVERSGIDQTIDQHEYTTVRTDGSLVRDVQFFGSPQQFKNNVEAYGYALDRWNPVASLTLEGGFRTQWDQYTGASPFAPRLAAAWSPKWSGGARFAAGWGIFYDAITLNQLALSQEQNSVATFYGPTGAVTAGPIETLYVLDPHDLRLPRFALTSFSAERKLVWGVYGKMNLISREGSRGFTFEETLVNPTINLYVLDNIQRQRYRAAEFTARRTFLSRYEWFASYTRSEARANAVIDYSVENPIFTPQAGGPLPWDAPNRFLAWGWGPVEKKWFPHFLAPVIGDTDAQILVDYRTGFPFSVTDETGDLIGPPDSRRFPSFGTVNVALERRFLFRGYLWAWRVALINVLNRANPNVVNSDIDSPQFLTYQRGQARAVNVRLRLLGKK